MKKLKTILLRIYSVYNTPAIIVHEITHVISSILTLNRIEKVSIYFESKKNREIWKYSVSLCSYSKYFWVTAINNMSPFLTSLMCIITLFFNQELYTILICLYLLTNRHSYPSPGDWFNMLTYKKPKLLHHLQMTGIEYDENDFKDLFPENLDDYDFGNDDEK